MTLLTDLDAFTREHMRCGELDGDVEEVVPGEWQGVVHVYVWGGNQQSSGRRLKLSPAQKQRVPQHPTRHHAA